MASYFEVVGWMTWGFTKMEEAETEPETDKEKEKEKEKGEKYSQSRPGSTKA